MFKNNELANPATILLLSIKIDFIRTGEYVHSVNLD